MSYTKAEFKTTRESLGITPDLIASRIGCHPNIVWRIESHLRPGTKVSPEAAAALDGLKAEFERIVADISLDAQIEGVIRREGGKDALAKAAPSLPDGWPERSYALILAEVQRRTHLPIDYTESE